MVLVVWHRDDAVAGKKSSHRQGYGGATLHLVELRQGRDLRWVVTRLSAANVGTCNHGLKKGAKWMLVSCGSDWDDEASFLFCCGCYCYL